MLDTDSLLILLVSSPSSAVCVDDVSEGIVADTRFSSHLPHWNFVDEVIIDELYSLRVRYLTVDVVVVHSVGSLLVSHLIFIF